MKTATLFLIALAPLILLVGYGFMHILVYILPMSEHSPIAHMFFTIALIGVGLAAPYWMLKTAANAAHNHNPHEKEFHLTDIPLNKDELQKHLDF